MNQTSYCHSVKGQMLQTLPQIYGTLERCVNVTTLCSTVQQLHLLNQSDVRVVRVHCYLFFVVYRIYILYFCQFLTWLQLSLSLSLSLSYHYQQYSHLIVISPDFMSPLMSMKIMQTTPCNSLLVINILLSRRKKQTANRFNIMQLLENEFFSTLLTFT